MDWLFNPLYTPSVLGQTVTTHTAVLVSTLLLVVLAWKGVRAPGVMSKTVVIVLVPVIATVGLVLAHEQRSWPKRLAFEWIQGQGEDGIAVKDAIFQPPVRISVFTVIGNQPRLFEIPWSERLEKQLREALRGAQGGQRGQVRLRYQPSLEDDPQPNAYMKPWPAPTPKEHHTAPPEEAEQL